MPLQTTNGATLKTSSLGRQGSKCSDFGGTGQTDLAGRTASEAGQTTVAQKLRNQQKEREQKSSPRPQRQPNSGQAQGNYIVTPYSFFGPIMMWSWSYPYVNILYKWISKTLTLRLEKLAFKLILQTQSAFLKGRNIMNGVLALHEILHETKRKRGTGVVLKLDFEKAYNKVNWNFLFDCLKLWGFSEVWISWIRAVVTGGTICVKMNNEEGPYFVSHKGV